ncbi:MAG: ferredoxin [Chloroflexota bacterium]
MKLQVDRDLCIGCGLCAEIEPQVFELQDDGYAHVINENPDPSLRPKIQEAIDECPTDAISLAGE